MHDLYPLKPFRINKRAAMVEVIRQCPLATLISGEAGSATLTLVPLLVQEHSESDLLLAGHIDRNNPHAEFLVAGTPVSFQFRGPEAYASPDLYPSRQLPGWLYVEVHGHGKIDSIVTERPLRNLLVKSTEQFGDSEQSFTLDADDERVTKYLPDIVGFSIRVSSLEGIAKLAQDKGPSDSQLARQFLAGQDNTAFAELFEYLASATGVSG